MGKLRVTRQELNPGTTEFIAPAGSVLIPNGVQVINNQPYMTYLRHDDSEVDEEERKFVRFYIVVKPQNEPFDMVGGVPLGTFVRNDLVYLAIHVETEEI